MGKLFLFVISSLFINKASASETTMIDLTQPREYQRWQATNDNVMGGISQGEMTFDGQSSRFSGEISLANNGGFSSINRPLGSLPAEVARVELIIIGDGRLYQMRLATWTNSNRITYKHEFSTIKGQRQKIEFELNNFQAVFRGRLIYDAPPLAARDIKQVGVLIADKQPGPFAINLIQIQFKAVRETE